MARRDLVGLRVVITGASSGIGWHLAEQLGKVCDGLVITARRADRLDQLATLIVSNRTDANVLPLAGDLTEALFREQLMAMVREKWTSFDLLINCAGVGAFGAFEFAKPDRLQKIMAVNFFAAAELSRLAIPILRTGRNPMIVNVGSVLARRAVPFKSEYCASKFALQGWSESLRAELASSPIDVLVVHPSTTESEFFENLVEGAGSEAKGGRQGMCPSKVAEKIVQAIRLGKHELILTWQGKQLVGFNRFFPGLLDWGMSRFAKRTQQKSGRRDRGTR